MSAAPSAPPPWMQELPGPNPSMKFVQTPPRMTARIGPRATDAAQVLLHYIAEKSAEQDFGGHGVTEVTLNMLELRQLTRKSVRCIEYLLEEIGQPRKITSPKRLEKLRKKAEETGKPVCDMVGKNFAVVKTDPRSPGVWRCRLLPENWSQGPGQPGAPLVKPTRKPRTLRSSHESPLRIAALNYSGEPPSAQSIARPSPQSLQGPHAQAPITSAQIDQAQLFAPADQPRRQSSGEEPQLFAPVQSVAPARLPYRSGISGEDSRAASAQFVAPGSQLRAPAQSIGGEDALLCTYPLCRKSPEQINTELASPAQLASKMAAEELAQTLQDNRILIELGPPNVGTCENLLDRNRMKGLPGGLEVASFLSRHQDRSSWRNWGVVVAAVREDLMPWLLRTGWLHRTGIWSGRLADIARSDAPVADGPPQPAAEREDASNPSPWMRIKLELKREISPQDYENWINRTEFLELQDDYLVVWVPDQITMDWMEQEFAAQIAAILIRLDLPVAKVVYKPHLRNTAVVNCVRQHHSAPN
jgi:hypothetical protein